MSSDSGGDDPHRKVHVLYMQSTRGKIIRAARVQKGISQERLGELTGVSRSAVNQWESDTTQPDSAKRLQLIADILDLDVEVLVRAAGPKGSATRARSGTVTRTFIGHTPPPLVIWRAIPHSGGRYGGFVILHEQEGEAPRPMHLLHQKKAFSFKVIDESNSPVYKPRDTLLIDPDTAAIPEDDCLFADGIENPKGSLAIVGYLKRITPTSWVILQYKCGDKEVELPKAEYPHAWPIVGRYHRR